MAKKIPTTAAMKRDQTSFQLGDYTVTTTRQKKNSKLDNLLIDYDDAGSFGGLEADMLAECIQMDFDNCYPIYVRIAEFLWPDVQLYVQMLGLTAFDVVCVPPSLPVDFIKEKMMLPCSLSKGVSKGRNGRTSLQLDVQILSWVTKLVKVINPDVQIIRPTDQGSSNEDIRIVLYGMTLYRQENKRISELMNITERTGMVKGKATSGDGQIEVYDALCTFIGHKLSFLDEGVTKRAPAHIAKAYYEFSLAEQREIMQGSTAPFENKRVLRGKSTNPRDGFVECELLSEYIASFIPKVSTQEKELECAFEM